MSLHPAVEKERFGGFSSQFPYNDDSQHCDVHRTPQQSFRRTRARACRARAGQGNDAEGTIGFACRSRHRRMEGTNTLRLYCALVWWRPGRVRTQEETFQGSLNPSSQGPVDEVPHAGRPAPQRTPNARLVGHLYSSDVYQGASSAYYGWDWCQSHWCKNLGFSGHESGGRT